MKTVAAGAHYTTVTVDTEEEVKFSFPSTSLSVEAAGGDITVALTETAQAGDDETITVPDGESRMFIHHRMNIDTYYLTGSGTAKLYASNMGDVNPFKAGKRGGDGGGSYMEVELYSNNEHAATPVDTVITLSQDWAEFDAIGFVSEYNSEVGLCAYNEYKVSVVSAISKIALNFNIGINANSAIFLRKNTSSSFVVNSISAPSEGLSHVYKIIGIKY